MELKANIDGIATKMLSNELEELGLNGLVRRTVLDAMLIAVQYNMTEYSNQYRLLLMKCQSGGLRTGSG